MRLGATVIPVNAIYTADEITYIMNNGDVKAVIALDVFTPLLQNIKLKQLSFYTHRAQPVSQKEQC